MNDFENFAEENLMIELGQMPSDIVLEMMYKKNVQEEEQEVAFTMLDMCQAWSWT